MTDESIALNQMNRTLMLLKRIVQDAGSVPLREQAESLKLPVSTAYRMTRQFCELGWVSATSRGSYGPSLAIVSLFNGIRPHQVIAAISKPFVERMARRLGQTVHFGVLEDDMVTYLLKAGPSVSAHFTRVGMQLEAYCSGIGKVLLAHLSEAELTRYLQGGAFVALTPYTITDPQQLQACLRTIAAQGYATDEREVSLDLRCLAVPVRNRSGDVVAAVSVSRLATSEEGGLDLRLLSHLNACALEISGSL